MILTVAIDGPVGAGKSTVARDVASELGILHLDTGAMYRAFAWLAIKEGIRTDDEAALNALVARALPQIQYKDGKQYTSIDGTDVTAFIRTPEISMGASAVSKFAGIRTAMVAHQQEIAKKQSMLLDGRDIGTTVLPNATLKIYLTASSSVRAQRRFDELQAKGDPSTFEEVLNDVIKRDEQDMNREVEPLRPADDAQILDCSDMTQAQVVRNIVRRIRYRQGRKPKAEENFTPMYKFARFVAATVFSTFMPIKYHNAENVQQDAPFILIANHNSMLDPLIVGWKCYRYQIRYLGKRELTKSAFLKWLFEAVRMIPVDRHNMDMSAIRTCMKVLKEGFPLGIFPEGTRHKNGVMEEIESGIAMIALRGGVDLIPAYTTDKPRLFRCIHVYYGQPISLIEIRKKGINKDTCEEVLTLIRQTYGKMVDEHEKTTGHISSK
ncbi:MAG: (d)CMP kinase [Clostridiales bacterium]|nr:(d)CMP kinase [Clostridiales bacterium]